MKNRLTLEQIRILESELAHRIPFGDVQHINPLIDRTCLQRLSLAENQISAARELKQRLEMLPEEQRHGVLRDTLLRIGIDQAMLYAQGLPTRYPLAWIVQVLKQAVSCLRGSAPISLFAALQPLSARLGSSLSSPLIWNNLNVEIHSRSNASSLEDIVHEMVPDAHIDVPSQTQIEMLKTAIALLTTLLPQLLPSVLNHVTAIVIVSHQEAPGMGHQGFGSGTNRSLPGVIVLSASELETPWRAAEILLHEALHLKFIDLEFTHSMNPNTRDGDESWQIVPPWRKQDANSEDWPPTRAMTAAHVYVGLSLLFHRSQLWVDTPDALAHVRPAEFPETLYDAADRAQFLLDELAKHMENLGLAGQYFVKWLQSLMLIISNPVTEETQASA